jgi:putative membrane protein
MAFAGEMRGKEAPMIDTWEDEGNVWKGAVAGVVAGLAAAWVMTQFQTLVGKLTAGAPEENAQHSADRGSGESAEDKGDDGHDATVKAAERLSRGVFHHELDEEEKKVAGPAMHYAMGAVSGGIYGAAAELAPVVSRGAGLPFGAAVWLAADEVAVPALGLSKAPTEYPASVHAQALAAHLVYGLVTDLVLRGMRRVL